MIRRCLIVLSLLLLFACARPGDEKQRFLAYNDGTILDEETGLMWAAADNGQSLAWPDAKEYCRSYTGGGHNDWRLPKKTELAALYKAGIKKDEGAITIRDTLVWAAETNDTKGASCNFTMGGCSWMEKALSFALRVVPVRDTRKMAISPSPSSSAAPPQTPEQRLRVIDLLHKEQLITQEEYEQKRAAILDEL